MIFSAIPENYVVKEFDKFISDYPLVGHGVGNDITYLGDAYRRVLHKKFNSIVIDTFDLALFLNGGRYSLSKLCDFFNLDSKNLHRAYKDAKITYQCYEEIMGELTKKYGIELDDKYIKWKKMEEIRTSKVLKNSTKEKINNKNWAFYYSLMLKMDDIEKFIEFIKGKNIVMSSKIGSTESAYIRENLENLGCIVSKNISLDSDFYIYSDEFSRENINLENKKLKKFIGVMKDPKMIGKDDILVFIDNLRAYMEDKDGSKVLAYENKTNADCIKNKAGDSCITVDSTTSSNPKHTDNIRTRYEDYELYGKTVFFYNSPTDIFKDDIYNLLKLNKCKVSNKLNYKVDYLIVLNEGDNSQFLSSKEYLKLILLLGFGCNITLLSEYDLIRCAYKDASLPT